MTVTTPIVPGTLVLTGDGPRLRGSRCQVCGTIGFPATAFCANPDCAKDRAAIEEWLGGPVGSLWSWTVQHYRATAPFHMDGSGPYAVAMVDLPDRVRVLGLLHPGDAHLRFGMPMELVAGKLFEGQAGPIVTWMWRPASLVTRRAGTAPERATEG